MKTQCDNCGAIEKSVASLNTSCWSCSVGIMRKMNTYYHKDSKVVVLVNRK